MAKLVKRVSVCAAMLLAISSGRAEAQTFGYYGEIGPEHWGGLGAAYAICGTGQAQSPIDFGRVTLLAARQRRLPMEYGETTGEIFNNGYTVEVETEGENELELDGVVYRLVQFHFHNPSEHRFDGDGADMELHLVHRSNAGQLAVVGVLMKRGPSSGALSLIFDNLPSAIGVREELPAAFNPRELLPPSLAHYRYAGSLTTPPCTEGVTWMVLEQAISVSDEDVARFAAQVSFNARPVQRRTP